MDLPIPEPVKAFRSLAELMAAQQEATRQAQERMFKSASVLIAEAMSEMNEEWAQEKKRQVDAAREFDERLHAVDRFMRENPNLLGRPAFEPGGDSED